MIDKPIYMRLQHAVGEAHGDLAVCLVLRELEEIFEMFGKEVMDLYRDDPELDDLSKGYYYAAGWCRSWAEEIEDANG